MVMHPAIKLRHIRAFLDIAAAQNLTSAARAQGITQPALSRSLAELEDLLGQSLFLREGRRLHLTEAGRLFRHHAAQGLAAFEAGAGALSGAGRGKLTVGVLPTAANRLFPAVALRLHAALPDVQLSVITGPQAYLMGLLRAGEIDMLIGRLPHASEMAGLSFEHLYDEDVVLAARAGHPMAAATPAEALRACPLILPPEGAIIRRAVDEYLASLGLAGLRGSFETVALPIGRGIVLGSDALWFISRGVIGGAVARGEMVLLPCAARYLSGAVGITRRHQPPSTQGYDLFIQTTHDCVGEGLHL